MQWRDSWHSDGWKLATLTVKHTTQKTLALLHDEADKGHMGLSLNNGKANSLSLNYYTI